MSDANERKQMEDELRLSEERLQQVIDVSHIGVFDHDHVAKTMYLSASMREFVGIGREDVITGERYEPTNDDRASFLRSLHPDDRERVAAKIERSHREGGIYEDEHRLVRPDGSIRWVSVRAWTTVAGEGASRHPVRTVGAMIDITDRKQAEEERERLQGQLVQAQKMESVGRLAGGVAHDFNNMLNVMCGYADVVAEQLGPDHGMYWAIDEIRKAGRRSTELTNQLLTFARRQPVVRKVLNINERIEISIKMVRRLIGEDIYLVYLPGDDLWPVHVDPTQIDQVLVNLSVNARDAISGVGQVTIRTSNVTFDESQCKEQPGMAPGEYVMLEVTDDGHGMDAETKSHIFEPFYTTKADGHGTGLGLATVYGIIKQNEGFISVTSEVGRGTRVQVVLPRSMSETDMMAAPAPGARPQKGTETVLLVEDEPMVLGLSKHLLEALGYTVLPAGTPDEALRLATEHGNRIQLLLTDVVMPEMNGPDLAKRLTTLFPHLKCMFVSGYYSGSIATRGVLEEGAHFLQKPFKVGDLAARVREALESP